MKQCLTAKQLLLVVCLFVSLALKAQNFHLLKDINVSKDGNPQNQQAYLADTKFAVLNNEAYFAADDGVNGSELWKTNITNAGTQLVKDINAGNASSNITNITRFKNKVIFSALDNTNTYGVWISDGTSAGTVLLKHIPSAYGYKIAPAIFTNVNDSVVYFLGTDSYPLNQLWKTDGTQGGTQLVVDFYTPDFYGSSAANFTSFKGHLFFTLTGTAGNELWTSDGTKQGTKLYKDILPGNGYGAPFGLTVVNNSLLFFASDDGFTTKLWQTFGNSADVASIGDAQVCASDYPSYTNHPFYSMGNNFYFNVGHGLGKFNTAAPEGITYLANFFGGEYVVANNTMFISVGGNLLKTDGNSAPVLIKSLAAHNMTAVGDKIFFTCNDGVHGNELWQTDGTEAGTIMVKDIFEGQYSSAPYHLTPYKNNSLLFAANDGLNGIELWKTNSLGTAMVKNINQTTTTGSQPDLYRQGDYIINSNNQLLFSAADAAHGFELYATDGTAAGTNLLKDVIPGQANGFSYLDSTGSYNSPILLTNFNNKSYFFPQNKDSILRLWATDGTAAGTFIADSFSNFTSYRPQAVSMASGKSQLYVCVSNGQRAIYATDGNSPKRLMADHIDISQFEMATVGDTLFFENYYNGPTFSTGVELWMTDGTAANTKMVKDINASRFGSSNPTNLMVFKNKLYFAANDGSGNGLWVSDGSEAGTKQVKKVTVAPAPYYRDATNYSLYQVSGNKLYFIGNDGSGTGNELWVTDGTENGTHLVKDINPGTTASGVNNMIDINGTLFFAANDGVHGQELWKSDGAEAGTIMVKEIDPGAFGTNILYPINNNGKLLFYDNNLLWESDGTEAGTKVAENFALSGLSAVYGMAAAGGNIIVTATSYAYGSELYIYKPGALPVSLLSFTGSLAKTDAALAWQTTNEINSDYFIVQRSTDGAGFINVGKINAAGNTTGIHYYNFIDVNVTALNANALYYRLQQADKDGKTTASNTIKIDIGSADGIVVTPNPAHKTAYIRSSTGINNAVIVLTDMAGHVLYTTKQNILPGVQVPVNIANLSAGTYSVTIQAKGITAKQFKLLLQ